MSVSGTATFSQTRDDIITGALKDIGALVPGETPTYAEITDCATLLNLLVKQWQGRGDFAPGLKMWTRYRFTLFMSMKTGTYALGPTGSNATTSYTQSTLTQSATSGSNKVSVSTIGLGTGDNIGVVTNDNNLFWTTISAISSGTATLSATLTAAANAGNVFFDYALANIILRPLQILTGILTDTAGNDLPLFPMDLPTYEGIPVKSAQGDPNFYYYESQIGANPVVGNGTLYTDVYPSDVTKVINFVALRPVDDFTLPTDTADYPQHWYLALRLALAILICPMFGIKPSEGLVKNAAMALASAANVDPETTTAYFQPDIDDYLMNLGVTLS